MKKTLSLFLAVLLSAALNAQTQSLTFKVDMNQQTVSPNGVHVAGNFQAAAGASGDWQPGESTMLDGDGDGIYELTVNVPAGLYEFKYINGNDWSEQPEGVPGECSLNGNRSVEIVDEDVTLDPVCFAACADCPGMSNDITLTLQVDMSQQPSVDPAGVSVGGTFNGFAPESMNDNGDGTWSLDVTVAAGSTVLWKYINGQDFGANTSIEQVPGDCGQDDGFGGNNRILTAPAESTVLDPVCYSSCESCDQQGEIYDLTLIVDASQVGMINASGIHAAGTFNSFSPAPMADQGDGTWALTVSVEEGSTVLWKYINGPTFGDEVESVPGDCGQDDGFGGFNRVLTMPSADTTAGPVCFSACTTCDVAPDEFLLTLIVDASDLDEINPDGGIHVAGTFNGFSPAAMTDDGDGLYSFTTMVSEGSTVLYKFLNSPNFDNAESVPAECGQDDGFGGFNRVLTMPSEDLSVGPVCFSSCEACPEAPACELPYPQVDGLGFTNQGNGILLSWNPIEGSIGCQLFFQLPNGNTTTRIKGGSNVSDFFIPGNLLQPFETYSYRVRCGCSQNPLIVGPYSETGSFFFVPPAIMENEESTVINAVPNPNNGISYISLNTNKTTVQATLEVFDMSGRLVDQVFQGSVAANQEMRFEFNRTDLPEGIYLIRYVSNGEVTTEKMMITK
ncbi:MAG: T9SS type A sorting domain-containing protein [Bacteroidota bacterium]